MISTKAPRNLFEFDNARYLSSEEIVETFLPTKAFWRLLSAKNHVVLGARGSGKTAIARMLAHPQLAKFREPRARKIVASKSFIGLYVPTKAEWIGGLRNKPWLSDAQKERLFAWRMNVATCLASLATLRSCLDTYVEDEIERLRLERALASRLAADWFPDEREVTSLGRLKFLLEDIEFKKHQELAAGYTQLGSNGASELGLPFHVELFLPLRRAIRHASEILDFPDTTIWLLCLDEAEALEEFHQRILNSYLRTHSDNLVFKLTTTPYGHYTLETNVGADLSVGNDFEYIYIDRDFVTGATERGHEPTYEARLFRLRAKHSGQKIKHISLRDLLGRSPLLSPIESGQITREELITEIRRSGDQLLKRRTELLSDSPNRFNNEIARKLAGIVLLRAAVSRLSGQEEIDLYAGSSLVVRCTSRIRL